MSNIAFTGRLQDSQWPHSVVELLFAVAPLHTVLLCVAIFRNITNRPLNTSDSEHSVSLIGTLYMQKVRGSTQIKHQLSCLQLDMVIQSQEVPLDSLQPLPSTSLPPVTAQPLQ